jgi:hypothetical protein
VTVEVAAINPQGIKSIAERHCNKVIRGTIWVMMFLAASVVLVFIAVSVYGFFVRLLVQIGVKQERIASSSRKNPG